MLQIQQAHIIKMHSDTKFPIVEIKKAINRSSTESWSPRFQFF